MTVNDVIHQRRIRAVAHADQIGNITQAAAWAAVSDYRFDDGVVVEVTAINDLRAMVQQLTAD